MRPLSKVETGHGVLIQLTPYIRMYLSFLLELYRLVEIGILLMIFRSSEQNLYSTKPSDETLKQGRNRSRCAYSTHTLTLTLYYSCWILQPNTHLHYSIRVYTYLRNFHTKNDKTLLSWRIPFEMIYKHRTNSSVDRDLYVGEVSSRFDFFQQTFAY